jgi:flagellar basal body-associated protein FliL
MIGKILPILLGLIGFLIGGGAGYFLRPSPDPAVQTEEAKPAEPDPAEAPEYAKLSNQFIVPVVQKGKVAAMVIMSLSLEVTTGSTPTVYDAEPKLRDKFLQVMFDHANSGGFGGSYTDGANLVLLRGALLEAAKAVLGDKVTDVLITDIVRQDS